MRIALLADLHGNLAALEAVLADIAATGGADTTLAMGDIAMLGPQPAEVIARLQGAGCTVIQGNTDAWFRMSIADDYTPRDDREAIAIMHYRWAKPSLSAADIAFLLDLPFSWQGELGGGERLLAVHGSPRRIDEPIMPETSGAELDAMLAGVTASVVAFGHTHRSMIRRHKGITLVNPGTVGNPIPPDLDTRAAYGLASWENGRLDVALRRVAYDPEPTLAAARERGMPGADAYAAKFR
jgi:predicted phosphodiesterase